MNAQLDNILPKDFQEDHADIPQTNNNAVLVPNSLREVIVGHVPLALYCLGQINFKAGVKMMDRLRYDYKQRLNKDGSPVTSEQDLSKDKTTEDFFKSMVATDDTPLDLVKTASIVAASLILADRLSFDKTDNQLAFVRKSIYSPVLFIEKQSERAAGFNANNHLVRAERFGMKLEAEKMKAKLLGASQERDLDFKAEVNSACDFPGLAAMSTDDLIAFIEDNYDWVSDWRQELIDRIVQVFESTKKKVEEGWSVDMDDTLIAIAREAIGN